MSQEHQNLEFYKPRNTYVHCYGFGVDLLNPLANEVKAPALNLIYYKVKPPNTQLATAVFAFDDVRLIANTHFVWGQSLPHPAVKSLITFGLLGKIKSPAIAPAKGTTTPSFHCYSVPFTSHL